MLVPEMGSDRPPNGILIYFSEETGHWVISANRFREIKVDHETREALIAQAKEFLREAQEHGLPVVDPDDDAEILSRLPKEGDSTPVWSHTTRRLSPSKRLPTTYPSCGRGCSALTRTSHSEIPMNESDQINGVGNDEIISQITDIVDSVLALTSGLQIVSASEISDKMLDIRILLLQVNKEDHNA